MDERAGAQWIEQACYRDMFAAAPRRLQRRLGLRAEACGPALVLRAPGLAHPMFNRAIGLSATAEGAGELVDSVVGRFDASGVERFFAQVPAEAAGEPLRARLGALGLSRYRRNWHDLARGPGPAPQGLTTDLRVERVGAEWATEAGALLAIAFDLPGAASGLLAAVVGRPGWHTYAAFDGPRLSAVGLMFVEGRRAFLAGGGTAPSHRRRGAQGALMTARVQVALALGCELIASNTGEEVRGEPNSSYQNMLRCGLRPIAVIENWTRSATAWAPGSP